MNRESQKRKIRRFLEGKGKKDLDAFCIYQWIDRCHYEGWWELSLALAPSIPPNSLKHDCHKYLEYLLTESAKNLQSLKKDFIKISNPGNIKNFLIPKSFCKTCHSLGLTINGRSRSGLKFELAGEKILFIQNIDMEGCVIRFYKLDMERFISWLNSNGFEHLVPGLIPVKDQAQSGNSKLKISWEDVQNLMPSFIAEFENDGTVLLSMFFEAIAKVKNGTWSQYLDYVKKKYSIRVSNETIEKRREVLIKIASGLEGFDQFVKRIESD